MSRLNLLYLLILAGFVLPSAAVHKGRLKIRYGLAFAIAVAILAGLVLYGPSGLATFYHQQLVGAHPTAPPPSNLPTVRPTHRAAR